MEEKLREKLLGVLSKSSRTMALFLGFSLVFSLLYILDKTSQNPVQLSADILAEEAAESETATLIQDSIEQGLPVLLANMLQDVPGAKDFLADAQEWEHVSDARIQEIDNGIFVTVQAAKQGDTLHPYFGYFQKENAKITRIFWSGLTSALLESRVDSPENDYHMTTVVNTSAVPWLIDDSWVDEISDTEIVLLAADKSGSVVPGASGTFVIESTEMKIVPKNVTRGFLVQITE